MKEYLLYNKAVVELESPWLFDKNGKPKSCSGCINLDCEKYTCILEPFEEQYGSTCSKKKRTKMGKIQNTIANIVLFGVISLLLLVVNPKLWVILLAMIIIILSIFWSIKVALKIMAHITR